MNRFPAQCSLSWVWVGRSHPYVHHVDVRRRIPFAWPMESLERPYQPWPVVSEAADSWITCWSAGCRGMEQMGCYARGDHRIDETLFSHATFPARSPFRVAALRWKAHSQAINAVYLIDGTKEGENWQLSLIENILLPCEQCLLSFLPLSAWGHAIFLLWIAYLLAYHTCCILTLCIKIDIIFTRDLPPLFLAKHFYRLLACVSQSLILGQQNWFFGIVFLAPESKWRDFSSKVFHYDKKQCPQDDSSDGCAR